MKAIVRDRYGSPDVLRFAEVAEPVAGNGQAVVRVAAASLNTADSEHLRGRPRVARLGTGLRRPATGRVGLDVAGTVVEVGPDVSGLRVGDEVWADLFAHGHGSFAEYVCAPASAFASKPAGVTFDEAASVPHSGILALQGLRAGGEIRTGDSVLINGAGGCVGPFAVQIAKAFGAEVTAVDSAGKLDMLRKLGADHVVNFTKHDITTSRRRFDLILDIADTRSVLHWRRCLRRDGAYVLIARTLSGFAQAALVGGLVTMTSNTRMGVFMWRPNEPKALDALADLLRRGLLTPHIDRRFRLADTADAFRFLEAGHARGKIVVSPE